MSRRIRFVLGLFVGLVALLAGTWTLMNARTVQAFGTLTARVPIKSPLVALTFDDGPVGHGQLLPVLRAHRARATFFVLGSDLERPASMAIARRMVAEGHELGNHSYSHQRMVFKPYDWIAREIESTDQLIRLAGHTGAIHVRPPYGKKLLGLPHYLSRHDRKTIMWDVEPESDPAIARSSERITAHVLEHVKPGSIVLLHGNYPETPAAVGPILAGLSAKGFRCVTVSELLQVASR